MIIMQDYNHSLPVSFEMAIERKFFLNSRTLTVHGSIDRTILTFGAPLCYRYIDELICYVILKYRSTVVCR